MIASRLVEAIIFMAVFFPVAMMGGTSGAFYTQFGITMASQAQVSRLEKAALSRIKAQICSQ